MVDSRRVQSLNEQTVGTGPVLYVMAREQRVADNWALLYAAEQAVARDVPLLVLFALAPMFNNGSARHNEWMVASLQEVAANLTRQQIPFYIRTGDWVETVLHFVQEYHIGEVVFDFNPLEPVRSWREKAAARLACQAAVVDARNVVPCFVASQKAEFAAHTFRPKLTKLLKDFLTQFPALPTVPTYSAKVPAIDWQLVRDYRQCDYQEPVPTIYTPGEAAAIAMLDDFITHRLDGYATKRNDPTVVGVSNLSPYLRWGNISAARVALAVQAALAPRADKEAFLEELIVRREVAENYVYYTPAYDTCAGAHAWAQKTLDEHRTDKREYIYTYEQFRAGKTHDELWNAMQRQLITEGKMHGWCRMYWAKKILEWTASPETAIVVALTLNDHYELDGRDSNGVTGVMWSICGVHDRAWTERPVFGKIRYMNFAGAKRKFPVAQYIAQYAPVEPELFND